MTNPATNVSVSFIETTLHQHNSPESIDNKSSNISAVTNTSSSPNHLQSQESLHQFLQQHAYRQQLQEEQQRLIAIANHLSFLDAKKKQQSLQKKAHSPMRNNNNNSNNNLDGSFDSVTNNSSIIENNENGESNNNNTEDENSNTTTTTTTLVQQKMNSAKDRFFASARENMRQRQIMREGVFGNHTGTTAAGDQTTASNVMMLNHNNNNSENNNINNNGNVGDIIIINNNFSFGSSSAYSSTAATAYLATQLNQGGGVGKDNNNHNNGRNDANVRHAIVKKILKTSSVFNVNSAIDEVEHERNDFIEQMMKNHSTNKKPFVGETSNTNLNYLDPKTGKRKKLAVFKGMSEPMMEHIDKVRDHAMLAALEASRSRTANETRQADAAATLQSFFRMVVVRRRFLRQKLNVAKQQRAIDRLRCCKAAMMLSRFCRGHNVRKTYRLQRAEIAAKRYDNLFRRSKIERSNTPGLQRVPPTNLIQGQNCTTEEWIVDVLARYNVNFVNAMRSYAEGNWIECIIYLEAHIKTSTVSAKEQSNEFLAEVLMRKVNDKLPAHVAAELLSKQAGRGGRRRY